MPNRAGRAGHIPERTCVSCKRKMPQTTLVRLVEIDGQIVCDFFRKLPGRGYYLCQQVECKEKMEKWWEKFSKKRKSRKTKRSSKPRC